MNCSPCPLGRSTNFGTEGSPARTERSWRGGQDPMWHYSEGRSTSRCSGEHPVSPGANNAPGLSPLPVSPTDAGFQRGHTSSPAPPHPHPVPSRTGGEGLPGGSAGVGGWRLGAGPRPGMSSAAPPGVAGRLHQTPRGAAARAAGRAGPSRPAGRLRAGRLSSSPAGT